MKFQCTSIPNVVKGYDRLFKRQAMEIIHWMATETRGMDLFANALTKNPSYERRSPTFREIYEKTKAAHLVSNDTITQDIGEVNVSILPNRTIEVKYYTMV